LSLFAPDRLQTKPPPPPSLKPVVAKKLPPPPKPELPLQALTSVNRFGEKYRLNLVTKTGEHLKAQYTKKKGGEIVFGENKINILSIEKRSVMLKTDKIIWKCIKTAQIKCFNDGRFQISLMGRQKIVKKKSAKANTNKAKKEIVKKPTIQQSAASKAQIAKKEAEAQERLRRYKAGQEALKQMQNKVKNIAIRDPKLLKDIPPGYKLHKSPFGDYLLPEK